MSILSPGAIAFLRSFKPRTQPLFSNGVLAEGFEGKMRRGDCTILPRTDGQYALVDERLPVGRRTVSLYPTEGAALRAIVIYVTPKGAENAA